MESRSFPPDSPCADLACPVSWTLRYPTSHPFHRSNLYRRARGLGAPQRVLSHHIPASSPPRSPGHNGLVVQARKTALCQDLCIVLSLRPALFTNASRLATLSFASTYSELPRTPTVTPSLPPSDSVTHSLSPQKRGTASFQPIFTGTSLSYLTSSLSCPRTKTPSMTDEGLLVLCATTGDLPVA